MKVSILGCGWLGLPLGISLAENGYAVKGSTTTKGKLELLNSNQIEPYLINIDDKESLAKNSAFFDCDILFLNIPPRSRHPELAPLFPAKVALILEQLQADTKVLFASTTGVYEDVNTSVNESGLLKESHPVVQAEQLIQASSFEATVLRFAGLIGGERHPAKNLAGRLLSNGEARANLVHLQDCIQIIQEVLAQGKWGKVYNVCADFHPTRQAIYTAKAIALGLEPPRFVEPHLKAFKKVDNAFLKKDLGYTFSMPDPMAF